MSRVFSVPGANDELVHIEISEPALRAHNLGLITWTSGFILASLLHKFSAPVDTSSRVPILELGAGTGLVGLTAARLWQRPVFLTDLSPILPALTTNISLNKANIHSTVECGTLDWSEPDFIILPSGDRISADTDKSQIILAADTMYSEEHPELLSKAIFRWLGPDPSARLIITWAMRVAYLDQIREIWDLLESGGLECVAEGREQADEDGGWDDEKLCEWSVWSWKVSQKSP
ncbi:hypothetical protein B0A52_09853 [Exophiala mesophila]|uniref:Uncharacterized protein n=1 Tax=Exophiala mesophila TaxID=212818 RepID=A0A438MST1_EXOME|nr:hypothetical protein B0A52_09853 [Exophiala mesophila]